jgi:hypothetical protein
VNKYPVHPVNAAYRLTTNILAALYDKQLLDDMDGHNGVLIYICALYVIAKALSSLPDGATQDRASLIVESLRTNHLLRCWEPESAHLAATIAIVARILADDGPKADEPVLLLPQPPTFSQN